MAAGSAAPVASAVGSVSRGRATAMIRWLIVVFLALVLINGLAPWLRKLGLGRLPGDFRFTLFGREWYIPLASTVLLSLLLSMAVKWL